MYLIQEKYLKVEKIYSRVIKILELSFEPNHPKLVEMKDTLGVVYLRENKFDKAEKNYKEILALQEEDLRQRSPHQLKEIYISLASLHKKSENYIQAELFCRKGLCLTRETTSHHETLLELWKFYAGILNNLNYEERAIAITVSIKEGRVPSIDSDMNLCFKEPT